MFLTITFIVAFLLAAYIFHSRHLTQGGNIPFYRRYVYPYLWAKDYANHAIAFCVRHLSSLNFWQKCLAASIGICAVIVFLAITALAASASDGAAAASGAAGLAAGILTNVATGNVIGLVGKTIMSGVSILAGKEKRKADEQKHKHEMERAQANPMPPDLALKGDLARLQTQKETLAASYQHDTAHAEKISQWAANFKTLMRPIMTLLFVGMFFLVTIGLLTGWFSPASPAALHNINSLSLITSTVVTWWFAERSGRIASSAQ